MSGRKESNATVEIRIITFQPYKSLHSYSFSSDGSSEAGHFGCVCIAKKQRNEEQES